MGPLGDFAWHVLAYGNDIGRRNQALRDAEKRKAAMTLPDDTEPSAEALEAAEAVMTIWYCWIRSGGNGNKAAFNKHLALALDRFRAAERERCTKWAECGAHRDSPLVFNIRSGEPYDR